MKFFDRDLWSEIWSTLSNNVLRTLLTMMGVIIAILILFLLLGSVTGMSNGFNNLFVGTATNSMFMWGQSTSMAYEGFKKGRGIDFELVDVNLIKQNVPEMDAIAPRIQLGNFRGVTTIQRNGKTSGSNVYGDYPSIDKISKKRIMEGRFINQNDMEHQRKVCVIGQDTYKLLFNKGEKALGEYIQINGIYFSVIGVYKKSKNINFDGQNTIIIPFSTFQKSFNSGNQVGWFALSVKGTHSASKAITKIENLFKKKYKIHPEDERAIGSFDLSEAFNGISVFTLTLNGFAFFVGIFTLLAGVISVSNILLITVKERTKEIGIRRALGATPKIIKRQILLESLVLTSVAGLVGMMISVGILSLIDVLTRDAEGFPFDNPIINFTHIFFSFVIMIGLSLLIGLIPARRATKVRPIEALREE